MRTFTVCRAANRHFVMNVLAEDDYDARTLVSRMSGWSFDSLTTDIKESAAIRSDEDVSDGAD